MTTGGQVRLQLLGPVLIAGADGKRPSAPARATEAIAFLALHPWDDHTLLDEAMWPGQRVRATNRSVLMHQARTWLGSDEHGRPHVGLVAEEGYRLHQVDVDVARFRELVTTSSRSASSTALTQALRMVKGQPLSGVNPARYTWADVDRQELISQIAAAAEELTQRALAARQARVASWASAVGLRAEPASESLWRLRMQAAAATGHHQEVLTAAAALRSTLEPLGELEPDTLDLLTQLTRPGSR